MNKELLKHEPELDEQIKWLADELKTQQEQSKREGDDCKSLIRMLKGIYQTCCAAKWMIEATTNELKKEPGNQPPEEGATFSMNKLASANVRTLDDFLSALKLFTIVDRQITFQKAGYNHYQITMIKLSDDKMESAASTLPEDHLDRIIEVLIHLDGRLRKKEVSNG